MSRGSIRQNRSGSWQIRVPLPQDPFTGQRRELTETWPAGTGRRTLELRRAELVSKAARSTPGAAPGRIPSVEDVVRAWLDLPRLAANTRRKARTVVRHLPPPVAAARADRVSAQQLDSLYRQLASSGAGAATIRNLHSVLSAAFGQAVKWGTIDRNPCLQATPPPAGRSRAVGDVTDTQIAALTDALAGDPQHALWLRLHLVTAARRAEVLAIRWSSISGNRLTINTAVEHDGTTKATKTGTGRTIALDRPTLDLIRGWQRIQRSRALELGIPLDPDPWLLSNDPASSVPWRPNSATQLFIRTARRAGVGGVRLHDLRHAAASFLLASGVDVTTVSKRLGHSSPRTTLNVYAHVLEGRDSVAADLLASRLA